MFALSICKINFNAALEIEVRFKFNVFDLFLDNFSGQSATPGNCFIRIERIFDIVGWILWNF